MDCGCRRLTAPGHLSDAGRWTCSGMGVAGLSKLAQALVRCTCRPAALESRLTGRTRRSWHLQRLHCPCLISSSCPVHVPASCPGSGALPAHCSCLTCVWQLPLANIPGWLVAALDLAGYTCRCPSTAADWFWSSWLTLGSSLSELSAHVPAESAAPAPQHPLLLSSPAQAPSCVCCSPWQPCCAGLMMKGDRRCGGGAAKRGLPAGVSVGPWTPRSEAGPAGPRPRRKGEGSRGPSRRRRRRRQRRRARTPVPGAVLLCARAGGAGAVLLPARARGAGAVLLPA